MADRTVRTIVTADVKGFVGGMVAAAASAKSFATSASKSVMSTGASLAKVASENSQAWGMVSRAMLAGGIAIAGGLALSAKAAIGWNSDWAGVTKTVDGTADQMNALENSLRGLAKTLPESHGKIAGLAEAAGQLGIRSQDVAGFTKVMIDLGQTTNLSSDQAATSVAQMMNIMGTATSNVGRLGSTLVALGNNGASTEAQIMQMGLRISAAGRQVGMSETDVLGLASALASVGIEAESGGTSASMALIKIDRAVRESGTGLQSLAKLTGMTASQFKQAWGEDAAGAMASVVDGLGKVQASGGSVNATLATLGITGIRETDAMGRLASATKSAGAQQDMLRDSLTLGKKAWDENNALVNEANKRYETAASKIQIAINNIVDSGISLGNVMLPAISGALDVITSLADGFGKLPPAAQQGMVAIAALAAGALLMGGGLMKAIAWVKDLKVAIGTLRTAMMAANVSMSAVGLAATGIGAAIAIAGAAFAAWTSKQQKATDATNDYTQALQNSSGAIDQNVQSLAAKRLTDDGAIAAAQKLGISVSDVTDAVLGNAEAMERVQEAMKRYRGESKNVAVGSGQQSKQLTEQGEAAKKLADSLKLNGDAFTEAAVKAKQYADANAGSASASTAAGAATASLAAQTDAQHTAMNGLLAVTQQYASEMLKLSGSEIALEAAIDDATGTIAKNGKTLNINTAAGRANKTALNNIAQAGMSVIQTLVEQGASTDEVAAASRRATAGFIEAAIAAGMNKDAAKKLADQYFGIPSSVATSVTDNKSADSTRVRIENLNRAIKSFPKSVQSNIRALIDQGKLGEAEAALNNAARQRTATIKTTVLSEKVSVDGTGAGKYSLKYAGGILEYYGAGGTHDVANRHVAELAPQGTTRVWREPETKGEGYIPLADDWRRPRAKAVASEIVRRFGGDVQWHAVGGVSLPAYANGSVQTGSASQTTVVVESSLTADMIGQAVGAYMDGASLTVNMANGRAWFDAHSSRREAAQDRETRMIMGV